MKHKIPLLLASGMIPLATTALAGDFTPHVYVNTDLGAAFQENVRINSGSQIAFHNGVRGDLSVGYQVKQWLAAELNTGCIWNSADRIGGVPVTSFDSKLDLYQVPILVNVILSAPAWHGLRPYVGGGAGGMAALLEFQRPLGGIRDSDITFGYQGMAGVNYRVSEHVEIGVGYKYFHSEDHTWVENGVTLNTGGTANHSVLASFVWSF